MPGPKHTPEQIVRKVRTAEVELAKGLSDKSACTKLGVTDQTWYRWRKDCGVAAARTIRRPRGVQRV